MSDILYITQPDDMHIHLRDGAYLARTVADASARFGRAIVMPNLKPPVLTVVDAIAYRERILAAVPNALFFNPLMTLYLTDNTSLEDVKAVTQSPHVYAYKWYPRHATTHSDWGVSDARALYPVFNALQQSNVPLLIHGEVAEPDVDIFDREAYFIDRILMPLLDQFPNLRVVLEHITTKEAVEFILQQNAPIAATITPHHLHLNRNDLLAGGIRPHYYCLPIVKRYEHQHALISAAISGSPKFFLGTDSAPHARNTKETACGCAGIYSTHAAIELYAEIFEQHQALDKLEAFASHFGADFYGLARNKNKIMLKKMPQKIPETLHFGESVLVPFRAGEMIAWSYAGIANE